ncbi:hypothetical protein [Streptomyces sp. NPDC054975]
MTQPSPAEHCGHQPDRLVSRRLTECVLRPGHSGSHADQTGMRWWMAKQADAPTRHTVDSITSDALDQLYADLNWAREQLLAAQQETTDAVTRAERAEAAVERVRAELDAIDRDRARLDDDCDAFGGGYADAVARIRAALDEHQEQ